MGDSGILKQFFSDRQPVITELHQGWTAMVAKLGDQGWEMVSAFANEGGRGKSPATYVFKRPLGATSPGGPMPVQAQQASVQLPSPPTPILPEDDEADDEGGFRPLDLP
jgi:hypothetical protein